MTSSEVYNAMETEIMSKQEAIDYRDYLEDVGDPLDDNLIYDLNEYIKKADDYELD